MRDIRSRMNRYKGTASNEHETSIAVYVAKSEQELYADQWVELGVTTCENEFGQFLMRTKQFKASTFHGMHQFAEWRQAAMHLDKFYPNVSIAPEKVLFLDLETTGLGSGAGNIPFMIGLAYWQEQSESIVVQQAFIRHPAEERAMLAYLHRLTKQFTHLVTYNGKSFDWPLMHSRFVLHGMKEAIWEPHHIDLLHPSRALWRNTLTTCRLSNIEEMRLGIKRENDVPGSEAPALYFKFLASGEPNILRGVYEHNELDMLSLVSLAIRFGHLLSDQDIIQYVQLPTDPEEMVRTGLWLEKMGLSTYSEQLFNMAAHLPDAAANTMMLLAARYKKLGQLEQAIAIWEKVLISRKRLNLQDHIDAATELAMYYEHKAKDMVRAYDYARIGLEIITQWSALGRAYREKSKIAQEAMLKRLARIERKLRK